MKKSMGKPPFYDAAPVAMPRTGGKGPSGSTFTVPNKGNYGLGLGQEPTRMSRTVGKGKSGNTFTVPNSGPGRAATSHKGKNSHAAPGYGVGGVNGGASGNRGARDEKLERHTDFEHRAKQLESARLVERQADRHQERETGFGNPE